MPTPVQRQAAFSSVARFQARTCTATFTTPTVEKNLLYVTASLGGGPAVTVTGPAGFTLIRDRALGNAQLVTWYYEGAPATSTVTVSTSDDRSVQLRCHEYDGAAQSGALDQVVVLTSTSGNPTTGSTGLTAQPDEIVVAAVANAYASTTQAGFAGGLVRLFESVSPQYYGSGGFFGFGQSSNADSDRTRLTVHELIASTVASFFLSAILSSARDWVAILVTFRGGSSGPKLLTSRLGPPVLDTSGGRGVLTAFGPLMSTTGPPVLDMSGGSGSMLPFNYQYRLNNLLIGSGTAFGVESTQGLGGWQVRTSDADLPRGDGALRGIDLESARQVIFKLNVGSTRDEVEQAMDVLFRALVPQRDTDITLIWRHPGQPAKLMRCRAVDLLRERSSKQIFSAAQSFVLRAADPRHYAAVAQTVVIPVTPAAAPAPVTVSVFNAGNVAAYPIITITGPTSGPAVNRVELVNATSLVSFDVALTLPAKSVLVGDMEARVTGAPRSVVTLDGQTKYGSWQLPRKPFRIDADPTGQGGYNLISLRTEPPGAPVVCTVKFRDTWAG